MKALGYGLTCLVLAAALAPRLARGQIYIGVASSYSEYGLDGSTILVTQRGERLDI